MGERVENIVSFDEYVNPDREEGVAGLAGMAAYLTSGGHSSLLSGEERIVLGIKDTHDNTVLVSLDPRQTMELCEDLLRWVVEAGTRRLLRDVLGG